MAVVEETKPEYYNRFREISLLGNAITVQVEYIGQGAGGNMYTAADKNVGLKYRIFHHHQGRACKSNSNRTYFKFRFFRPTKKYVLLFKLNSLMANAERHSFSAVCIFYYNYSPIKVLALYFCNLEKK